MKTIMQSYALLCISLLLFFLTACGTTAVIGSNSQLAQAGQIDSAKVYFLRPDVGYFGLEANAVSISIDGEKLLTLAKGEYTLVYLQPITGKVTVEALVPRTASGKTVVTTVKASEQVKLEAGKSYHIAVCKRYGKPEESLSFPVLIEGSYANEGSGALRPVGDAIHEPLSSPVSITQSEASSLLKDVCVAVQNEAWYARLIQADCVKVKQMLLKQGGNSDIELEALNFCANVVQECQDNPQGPKCKSLIQSYDTKRGESGTSLLMHIASSRIPGGNRRLYDSGDTAFMRYLLHIGFDPNAQIAGLSTDSITELVLPSYLAISKGDDARDVTPLMIATVAGDHEMVNLLLRAGANPNTQNDQGRTALMYAANLGNLLGTARTSIVIELLAAGANPNAVSTDEGATALMFAAKRGNPEVVKILLEHGANPMTVNLKGSSALSIAKAMGHTKIVEILQERSNPQ
jgi:Ankyrin repeats (3 copies)/Ankyrin repeat